MLRVFADVLVTPYTALAGAAGGGRTEGGPHWPNFADQHEVRQCRAGRPTDSPPQAPKGPVSTLSGRFAWGGGLVPHFGHQLIDHTMRLVPTLIAEPDISFIFTGLANTGIRSWEETPTFFKEIVGWHGLDAGRVRVLAEPMRIETLVVAPQAVQPWVGAGPADACLDYLDALAKRHLPRGSRAGMVYVSRSRMSYHYAGEAYLERILEAGGVRIVHPQCLPLKEQLRSYRDAEVLVLAEGSALHSLQLFGRSAVGRVRIVQRRFDAIRWVEPTLKPRAESIEFVNVLRGVLQPVGLPGSISLTWLGMGILDEDALLAALPTLFGDDTLTAFIRRRWNATEFAAQVEADVLQWATGLCQVRSLAFPESMAAILEQLRACGLASLAPQVELCLAPT